MRICVCLRARVCGQEVVVAGLRSVAGKNGNYAVAVTTAGHSAGFGFPDTLQPETASHHHSIRPSIPAASVSLIILQRIIMLIHLTFVPVPPLYAILCLSLSLSLFHPPHIPQHPNTPLHAQWHLYKMLPY